MIVELDDVIRMGANLSPSDSDSWPYVSWAHNVERVLRASFADVPIERLFTERFWRVQGPILLRAEMQRQEIEVQRAWLSKVRDAVAMMAERFSGPRRSIAVLDTNVLLHHKPLSDVDWADVVGDGPVLLAVPRRVVEELDARKYSDSKSRKRARTRISKLAAYVASDDAVRPRVDVEIIASLDLDPDAARRPPIPADAEIIETCEALTAYAGSNPVYLVTGDLSMQILAENRGLSVRRMPEETVQPLGEAGDD